ncbi:conserved unknown protein [Ectocarpus siliculosus]|uniref:Uncharacterized protein n=1 Tax=Ectocarpus siliculosus TaxID=2880 RepID=D7FKS6_ECTSI|nr:conserved unknown protein [Ectocarpus siliculosus]|eukprot:CBJ29475.1 conserved unknown protein [Ectocarpus siliculosus]
MLRLSLPATPGCWYLSPLPMVSVWRTMFFSLFVVEALAFVPRIAFSAPPASRTSGQQPTHERYSSRGIVARSQLPASRSVWGERMSAAGCSKDVPGDATACVVGRDVCTAVDNRNAGTGTAGTTGLTIGDEIGGDGRSGRRLLAIPPLLVAVATGRSLAAAAAVTGGRIGGGGYSAPAAAERTPSAPPMQQQQQYQPPQQQQQGRYQRPRAGRDIYGSEGSRFHIRFDGGRGGRRSTRARFNPYDGDAPSTSITPGDVAMIGGVSAAVAAVQRYNRKRFVDEEGSGQRPSAPLPPRSGRGGSSQTAVVTTLQLGLYCDRQGGQGDVLATLDKLSQTADVNSPRGLSTLINEVCLTLLRSGRDWLGGTGSVKMYASEGRSNSRGKKSSPVSRAKRDFNRAAMRERSKWERETVSNTPDRGFSSSTAPSWGGFSAQKSGTYAVATLIVAWSGLNSTPPRAEPRRGGWFTRDSRDRDDDRGVEFSVVNRQSALTLLEWLGDEAAEGRGENVLDVEVLWTPADPDDSLDREDLDTKWPELRAL